MSAASGDGAPQAADGDIAGDIFTTVVLPIGSSTTSTIDTSGDLDYFRVSLTAGQAYHFTMDGVAPGAIIDPFLEIRDAAGNLLKSDDDGGTGTNS